MPEICFMSVVSQEIRSGREGTPVNPYLKAAGLHICSNTSKDRHNGVVQLLLHAKILALGPVGVQRRTFPWCHLLWLRQAFQGPAGFLQAGSDCSKPPLPAAAAAEGCYQTNAGKKLKTVSHNAAFSSKKQQCGGFPSKTEGKLPTLSHLSPLCSQVKREGI